jgi:hypothetical protein
MQIPCSMCGPNGSIPSFLRTGTPGRVKCCLCIRLPFMKPRTADELRNCSLCKGLLEHDCVRCRGTGSMSLEDAQRELEAKKATEAGRCDACGPNCGRDPWGDQYPPGRVSCDGCGGKGEQGTGRWGWSDGDEPIYGEEILTCTRCGGSGEVRCTKCHGTGKL